MARGIDTARSGTEGIKRRLMTLSRLPLSLNMISIEGGPNQVSRLNLQSLPYIKAISVFHPVNDTVVIWNGLWHLNIYLDLTLYAPRHRFLSKGVLKHVHCPWDRVRGS